MEHSEMREYAPNKNDISTDKVNYMGKEFIPEDDESMFDESGDYYGEDYDESFLNDDDEEEEEESNSSSEDTTLDNLQKSRSFSNDSGKEVGIKDLVKRNYDSRENQSISNYVGEKGYKSGERQSVAAKSSTDITNQDKSFERDLQNSFMETMQGKDCLQNLQSKANKEYITSNINKIDNGHMDKRERNQLVENHQQKDNQYTRTMLDNVQENDYSDEVMPEYTSEIDEKEMAEFNEDQTDEFHGKAEVEENDDNFQDFNINNSGSKYTEDPEGYADGMTGAELPINDGEEYENEEPSDEEEETDESDEDFNEAINALGDLENEDLINEGELEEENMEGDNFENPDDTTNNDEESFPSTSGGVTEGSKDDQPKKKRKRKKKGEVTDEDGKKPKRKRKKKGEKSEDGEKKKTDKNARRNIRKILTESNLEKETLDAQNAELERQRRLADLKKVLPTQAAIRPSPEKDTAKEKDSQLKSLLQAAEETAEKETEKKKEEDVKVKEEKSEAKIKKDGNIIDISSGEDDDDCVMVHSEEEDEDEDLSDEDHAEAEDMNNSGSHINDMYNIPDKDGRVIVNVGHPTSDPDIYLSALIARNIKPHQIGGVRFLYDNLVECINRFKTSSGFGCILAHSMGLGKTIQMIGFIDIFLRHTGARTVLVIVPINTLANWMAEFNMWVPDEQTCKQNAANLPPDIVPRPYPIYLLNDTFKNTPARAMVVESWSKSGGVLLIGYEMYRLLSSKKVHLQKTKGRKRNHDSIIDVEEEDRDKKLLIDVHEALVNPGPDLVVCDEGHRIKNSHAGISQSLKQIKTKRRIVLTGYPLQNNLIEYWCMVDFVRPNFLGTKTEFCNMFERPIMNGQCADSTPQDVRLMRYRAHVLHSLLEGFVQRRGHTVLQAALPPKQEYVFMIRMSPIQKQLYHKFMESITESGQNGWVNNNPLKAFSVCCKIWNHPDILYTILKKSLDDNDLDIETGEPKKKGRGRAKKETPPATPAPPSIESDASNSGSSQGPLPPGIPSVVANQGPSMSMGRPYEPNITYDWANEIMKDYVPGLLENGGKMVMLFKIVQESLAVGDKILVFSQSLFTLNLVEEFLSKQKVPRYDTDEFWCKNKNYFRLDGSTSSTDREKLINQFNVDSTTWLFLLSTRAGSLGVNLVGANRVVVLDASWNPCHDCQAICRVYRFGQCKPSFIYRFVTENTMERKIYDRQVNKQGMSDRVVDELNPQNQFKRDHVEKLMVYEDKSFDLQDFSRVDEEFYDPVMISTLKDQGHWLTSRPFTHESLLIDRKELKLTMKEKRLAKQSYVMEKRLNVSYSRPSYAAYYPKGQQPYQGMIRGRGMPARPIASVKPIVSTPVPMKPKIVAAPQILKPGVSVHQVLTTTDITLPGTNTTTEAGVSGPKKIPAGQQVLVIRTPKGVYIRTPDGKIFAVRSKPQPDSTSPLDTLANTGSTLANTATSGGATTVTVVRAATSVSTASSTSIRTPVTVIRPGSGISSTKPLTIIRQGPGPIRTVIPVSIGSKSGGAANATATAQLMSQKVSTMIKNGAQIKIVNPNLLAGGKAGTTSASTGSKKIFANTLSFSGGNVVSTTTASKPVASVTTVKNDESSSENTMETDQDRKSEDDTKKKDTDSSWNLPPIDMQALKIPKQLNESSFQRNEQDKPSNSSSASKSVNSSKPTFSLSQTPIPDTKTPPVLPLKKDVEPAKLSTRPSDIDLHELQLSNNPVTTNSSQMSESLNTNSSQSTIFTTNNSFIPSDPSYTGAGNQQPIVPQQNNMISQQMQGFATDNMMSNNMSSQQMGGGMMNSGQPNNAGMYSQNQTGFGHSSMSDFSGNQSNFNNMSNFSGMNQYGGNNMGNQNFGYNSGMTGTGVQQHGYGGGSTDLNSDFNGIHNNSSFLSELNFSETDDNFLSQLSGANDNVQNQGNQIRNDSQGSNMFMNSQNFGGGGAGSMGMQGYQPSQQQNMNYDMFNSSQQNPSFFPKFGNNQFPVNNSFGGNQSFSQQGGYPSGSMYPMGGMMQPTMYGYPPFAPYPYAPMMPPMPYYPMPFQPQYGVGNSNMGNSNMGNSNMGNSNMGSSNMGNSSMGSQGGGFNMNVGQGDHSFPQNQTNSERTSN